MLSSFGAQVTQGGFFVKKLHCCLGAVLVALCCVVWTQVFAADTDSRRYTLPDHGSLQLKVPAFWKEQIVLQRIF